MASANFNFKSTKVGDVFTTLEGVTLTITGKVAAHTLYKGSQAYLTYTLEGIEGEHKATSAQICKICGLTNDGGAAYTSRTSGRTYKVLNEEQIATKVAGYKQRAEGAIKALRDLGVISHLAAVEAEIDYKLEELHNELTAASIKAQAEQDARAAAQAQAAADKAMAALKALSPEQMNALIAALAK
ncbi:MAG: hypothetical protein UH850_00065 [Paludibacteraceae bacterium]|nr:hypothetical protein [Paludibacteraceae bacterium]